MTQLLFRILLSVLGVLVTLNVTAAPTTFVSGTVTDSLSRNPIPFVSVVLLDNGTGGLTDDYGRFSLRTAKPVSEIKVSAMGYETKILKLAQGEPNYLKVRLRPIGKELGEVVVKSKKKKYSKKNNPAVIFMEKIRNADTLTDPMRHPNYSYDKYERITFGLNKFSPVDEKNLILKKFGVLRDYIDTSEVSGNPILNVSTREKSSRVVNTKDPSRRKEIIKGFRQEGLDDFLDPENMRMIFEEFLKEVDLYGNDVVMLRNHFVSPLSRIAPDFYKFFLTDTVEVGGERCIVLSFTPHNTQSFGFTGNIYVPEGDSTMFIKKVEMNVPRAINLNFVENLFISQEFKRGEDGSRQKVRDDVIAELSILPGTQGLYMRRNSAYSNHSYEKPDAVTEELISSLGNEIKTDSIDLRDEDFWVENRLIPISKSEENVGRFAGVMRQIPLYYWMEKFVRLMSNGYISTSHKDSKFDIGPLISLVSHNSLEGWRFRLGGMTTANLNPHLFARGFAAYGLRDKVWKYGGELEYSFNKKKYHSQEFPIHSLRLSHLYDVDMLGQHFTEAEKGSMFMALSRRSDYQITYHRLTSLEYKLELNNHFSVQAEARHERQEATKWMHFEMPDGRVFPHYNETSFTLKLRYAPGEKFYQMKSGRISINHEAPIITLSHTFAPSGAFGNLFALNRTDASFEKRFWLSAFGYVDVLLKGSHIWNKCGYPNMISPAANLSYTIQPETYSLLNPMEFILDSYAGWDITYWANGAIFNYIPLIKKLKLREVFGFKGFVGHLSKKNNPAYSSDVFSFPELSNTLTMGKTPYMEISAGIDNIFRFIRLEYVWRLTYRNYPGVDKSGIRIGAHFRF